MLPGVSPSALAALPIQAGWLRGSQGLRGEERKTRRSEKSEVDLIESPLNARLGIFAP